MNIVTNEEENCMPINIEKNNVILFVCKNNKILHF